MSPKHIGLIGLGTMGANLARNAARNGATVAVYNRTTEKTDAFMAKHASEGKFISCATITDLVNSLPAPRYVVLMVNAGAPVDAVIADLTGHLSPGDTIIDAGNSLYIDTERREQELQAKDIRFVGMGVSGGEHGALWGPSMMPGGNKQAFEELSPLFTKMAAKDGSGGKCMTYVGTGGAGHFVKMIHNGIEYGDMQLIAEAYHLLKAVTGMNNAQLAETFEAWNKGRQLKSFLIEITGKIFRTKDTETPADIIDVIKDAASQKGTGKWTVQAALDYASVIPTISAAVDGRILSSTKDQRGRAAAHFGQLEIKQPKLSAKQIRDALYLSKICSYAQGLALIKKASDAHNWGVNLAETCRIWKGGCIIRSTLLKTFEQAFTANPNLENLLLDATITEAVQKSQRNWRKVVAAGATGGIPLPAMSGSLSYFDAQRSAWLPQNLTQAQRDFFGAHTYERNDKTGSFHTQWESEEAGKA